MTGAPIRISSVSPERSIPREQVYFTFGSGRLGYDCVTCGAKCCRGFGYLTSSGSELALQLSKRPTLKYFVRPPEHAGGTAHVGNCAPGCFFLTAGGRCGIQADAGYSAKPETCRLFPFNHLRLVGDYLVVSPHATLCPLRCVDADERDERSDHPSLLDAMGAQGIAGPVTRYDFDRATANQLIEFERRVQSVTEAHAGEPFDVLLARQLVAAGNFTMETAAASVRARWQVCVDVLGIGDPIAADDPALNHLMGVLTPYFRSRFLLPNAGGASVASRVPPVEQAVSYLAALYVLLTLARNTGMTNLTFQSASQLAESFRGPLQMLAFSGSVVSWAPTANTNLRTAVEPFQIPAIRIAKSLLHSANAPDRWSTLGELLVANNPFDGIQRIEFLRFLATNLLGKIEVADAPRRQRARTPAGFKQRIQRLGLEICDESVLQMVWRRS